MKSHDRLAKKEILNLHLYKGLEELLQFTSVTCFLQAFSTNINVMSTRAPEHQSIRGGYPASAARLSFPSPSEVPILCLVVA